MMRYLLIAALLAAAPVVAPANCWQTTRVGTGYVGYCVKGTGPTVVIVNGGPGLSSAYVAPIADWLAEHGFRAVRFDERDVGHSSGFAASDVTVAGEVADVEAIRRALGISRIIVLAHSFGGTIAQAYAEQDSSRVARLLMLDVVPTNSRDYRAASSRVERRMTHAQIAEYRVWSTKQALAKNPREAGLHIFDAFIRRERCRFSRSSPEIIIFRS
jgi:pimeloyl-ACP methyl ester carboxylesterase